jgi:hypothetical protein
MPTPLKGTEGTIDIAGQAVAWVGEWEVSLENGSQTVGPHIGDATEYEVDTSQKWTFKASGTIPSGGDAGQDDIFDAAVNRTNPALTFTQTLGKSIAFTAPKYSKLSIKAAADGSHTFDAEGSNGAGTATLSQDV